MRIFVDNNIGQMYEDIFKDIKEDIASSLEGISDGEIVGSSTIAFSWKYLIPVAAIVVVVVLALIIRKAGQKRRIRKFEEATLMTVEENETFNEVDSLGEVEPVSLEDARNAFSVKEEEKKVLVKEEKKVSSDVSNVTKSGRVFTYEELEELIRK